MIAGIGLGVRDSSLVVHRKHALDLQASAASGCDEVVRAERGPCTLFWLSARTQPAT